MSSRSYFAKKLHVVKDRNVLLEDQLYRFASQSSVFVITVSSEGTELT